MATPSVVKKILRLKQEQPTMFAWEIREQLARQGACDPQSLPSVSSVNRILRGGGLQTEHSPFEANSISTYQPQIPSNVAAGARGRKKKTFLIFLINFFNLLFSFYSKLASKYY